MQTPPGPSRWPALVVLCAGMLMIILDQTIVNVALRSIPRDLGFSQSSLAWVANAYLIPFGGVLLLAGRLGDLLGRKRILISGLVVFTAASLLCGVAGNQQVLIAARFLEGVGGAIASALILGMIVAMFPEPHEQARALLLLVGFVGREATHPRPLLPLRVFKSRDVSGANLVQALMVAGMFGLFFLGSLYMQRVLRYDALQIGLAFLPVALSVGALSVDISARLCGRFGART